MVTWGRSTSARTAVPIGGVLLRIGLLLLEVRLDLEVEPYVVVPSGSAREVLAPPVRVGRGAAELPPVRRAAATGREPDGDALGGASDAGVQDVRGRG